MDIPQMPKLNPTGRNSLRSTLSTIKTISDMTHQVTEPLTKVKASVIDKPLEAAKNNIGGR